MPKHVQKINKGKRKLHSTIPDDDDDETSSSEEELRPTRGATRKSANTTKQTAANGDSGQDPDSSEDIDELARNAEKDFSKFIVEYRTKTWKPWLEENDPQCNKSYNDSLIKDRLSEAIGDLEKARFWNNLPAKAEARQKFRKSLTNFKDAEKARKVTKAGPSGHSVDACHAEMRQTTRKVTGLSSLPSAETIFGKENKEKIQVEADRLLKCGTCSTASGAHKMARKTLWDEELNKEKYQELERQAVNVPQNQREYTELMTKLLCTINESGAIGPTETVMLNAHYQQPTNQLIVTTLFGHSSAQVANPMEDPDIFEKVEALKSSYGKWAKKHLPAPISAPPQVTLQNVDLTKVSPDQLVNLIDQFLVGIWPLGETPQWQHVNQYPSVYYNTEKFNLAHGLDPKALPLGAPYTMAQYLKGNCFHFREADDIRKRLDALAMKAKEPVRKMSPPTELDHGATDDDEGSNEFQITTNKPENPFAPNNDNSDEEAPQGGGFLQKLVEANGRNTPSVVGNADADDIPVEAQDTGKGPSKVTDTDASESRTGGRVTKPKRGRRKQKTGNIGSNSKEGMKQTEDTNGDGLSTGSKRGVQAAATSQPA